VVHPTASPTLGTGFQAGRPQVLERRCRPCSPVNFTGIRRSSPVNFTGIPRFLVPVNRQNLLRKVHRRIGHSTAKTGRAKAPTFAAERHKQRVPTTSADQVKTAPLENPAAQVLFELSLDEPRQPACLLGTLAKSRPVLGDCLVKHGRLRLATAIAVVPAECACLVRDVCCMNHRNRPWRGTCHTSGAARSRGYTRSSMAEAAATWRPANLRQGSPSVPSR
jgi:hypothetical protein